MRRFDGKSATVDNGLQGIYAAALYRYASGDPITGAIDRRLLEDAFQQKA